MEAPRPVQVHRTVDMTAALPGDIGTERGRSTALAAASTQVNGPVAIPDSRRDGPSSPVRTQGHATWSPRAPQLCPQAVGGAGPVDARPRHWYWRVRVASLRNGARRACRGTPRT